MLAAEHTEQPGAELCPRCRRFPLDTELPLDLSQWDYVAPTTQDPADVTLAEAPQGAEGAVPEGDRGSTGGARANLRREGLSCPHVEKLLGVLKGAGLAKSHPGVKGGYTLARPADQITLGDIGRALGGFHPSQWRRWARGRLTSSPKVPGRTATARVSTGSCGTSALVAATVKKPLILGHEIVGRVVEAGGNARNLRSGDRVGVP